MTTKKSPEVHVGPLRRALRKAIEIEDPEYELLEREEYPFRYLIGKSLDKWIENIHPKMDAQDEQEALEIATRAMAYNYIGIVHWDIHEALSECESPIERIMLAGLITVSSKIGIGINLKPKYLSQLWPLEKGKHPSNSSTAMLTIVPQAQMGEYRVDFLLTYEFIETDYPDEAMEEVPNSNVMMITHPELAVHTPVQKNLILECDGHAFHEKTKYQAARDKRRDRALQSLGYKVFRFTGSEIYNDAISCAVEAIRGFDIDTGQRFPPVSK